MRVLQFSGGKDSLATLLLLKDQLHEITVLWADSGDSFLETYAQMEKVKAFCPNFEVVKGDQPKVIADRGYPSDVLPVRNHKVIQGLISIERVKLQGFLECCLSSFLMPMERRSKDLGATEIIRGVKKCDVIKGPTRDGDVIDGVLYRNPIWDWTEDQVMDFIKDSELRSPHYDLAHTSMDCMHCTAYLNDNHWKLPYLDKHYPDVGAEVRRRLKLIKLEVDNDMQHLNRILDHYCSVNVV